MASVFRRQDHEEALKGGVDRQIVKEPEEAKTASQSRCHFRF